MEQSTAEVPKQETTEVEVPQQDGSVEDAAAALASFLPDDGESDPEGQPAPQEAPAAEEVKQEADEAKPALLALKIGDKEYNIPIPADTPEEVQQLVKDGLLMRADYTRKTQETAELRKAAETHVQQLAQAQQAVQAFPGHLAGIRTIDAQLQQAQDPAFWQRIHGSDPTGVQALQWRAHFQDLANQRTSLLGELDRAQQHVTGMVQTSLAQRAQAALPTVMEHIPNFGKDVVEEMRTYAKGQGATDEQLNSIYDAAPMVMLWKAMQYDKLQQSQPRVTNKVQNLPPKVQRSGTASEPNSGPTFNKSAFERLGRSGSTEDAAAAIASLMR